MSYASASLPSMEALAWTAIGLLGATVAALVGALFHLGSRIDALGSGLNARIDAVGARIDALSGQVSDHIAHHAR